MFVTDKKSFLTMLKKQNYAIIIEIVPGIIWLTQIIVSNKIKELVLHNQNETHAGMKSYIGVTCFLRYMLVLSRNEQIVFHFGLYKIIVPKWKFAAWYLFFIHFMMKWNPANISTSDQRCFYVEITLIRRWKWNKIRHRIFIIAKCWYNVSARRWNNDETKLVQHFLLYIYN